MSDVELLHQTGSSGWMAVTACFITPAPLQRRLPLDVTRGRGHPRDVTELAGFHHVALTVRDLDASASWYRRVLDLQDLFREEGERRRAVVFSFCGGTSAAIGLVCHADADGPFDPMNVGLDHVSFAVRQREDLHAWARRLDEEGVEHSGVIDVPPGAILNFKDPDGIALAMFWDR